MTPPTLDAQVRLDTHPTHPSAVIATLTGTQHRTAHALLAALGFETVGERTLVLARIDHEEPYWAQQTARELAGEGVAAEITPRLHDAIDEEWTWANYPMHWCTREEIREVSDQANTLYEDIRRGRLVIHAHAEDGGTSVAVGTYRNGTSVYLHGENHLRQIADTFDSPAQAIAAFERFHGNAMRPGPAPATGTEQQTAEALTARCAPGGTEPGQSGLSAGAAETVSTSTVGPGDHEAVLEQFFAENGEWEKYRTWYENTTIATHESLTLRAELVHEAYIQDIAWTIAAYESPVGARIWHATMTSATPTDLVSTLLDTLAPHDAWNIDSGSRVTEKTLTEATWPLTDARWRHTVDSRWIRWQAPTGDAGLQFDAFAAQNPTSARGTWTLWGGPSIDTPDWIIAASPSTPTELLANLTETLADTVQIGQAKQHHIAPITTARPAPLPATARQGGIHR
ncbi:DUF317 domain-containing protein [Streptomyces sp. NPDC087851]|uniref:DUF317 domain-containing protein n=1 Tax=Streptomyces sp. NPDC087851 TaxID=3365810 RepID=UPI003828D630